MSLIPQLDCTTPLTGRATKKLIFDTFLKGSNAADIEAFVDELVRTQKISSGRQKDEEPAARAHTHAEVRGEWPVRM